MDSPGGGTAGLDLQQVEAALEQFYTHGLAASTQKSYSTGQKRFLAFCRKFKFEPFPPSERTLLLFIAHLGSEGLAMATIKSYLSAIRNLLINNGIASPLIYTARVELVIRGIKRVKGGAGTDTRLPITAGILAKLKETWSKPPITIDRKMLWAASCTAFFGFLRCAEFTVPSEEAYNPAVHLSVGDASLLHPPSVQSILLHIKQSKTDQYRKGASIYLCRTKKPLCPVSALLDYLATRGFKSGPLFVRKNGKPLTRKFLFTQVQAALEPFGLPASQFNGHSFRIGAATTAAQAGIPDTQIKMLGRWESWAYQSYIRTPREELASICINLASTTSS